VPNDDGGQLRVTQTRRSRNSPYFGLEYYGEEDSYWFCGRDAESNRVIANLRAARLTLLHARSGVGKTSLLRAGVASRLRKARTTDPRIAIPVVFADWKDDPIFGLVRAIDLSIKPFVPDWQMGQLPSDDLAEAILRATEATGGSLVLLLDQFEEFFVYHRSSEDRDPFAEQLATCINRRDLPSNFLVAVREDAYARVGTLLKGRVANVYGNYLRLAYMERSAGRKAIREPLDKYNDQPGVTRIGIEPELVERVLDGVAVRGTRRLISEAGVGNGIDEVRNGAAPFADDTRVVTPLLQLVMQRVWEQEMEEGSRELRLVTFERLEGVGKILDAHLQRALNQLDRSQQDFAVELLGLLVDVSGGKVAASVTGLANRTGHTEAEIDEIMQALDRARIVTSAQATSELDQPQEQRYEIYHDVLAQAIDRALIVQREREHQAAERERQAAEVERQRQRALLADRRAHRARRLAAGLAVALIAATLAAVALFYRVETIQVRGKLETPSAIVLSPQGHATIFAAELYSDDVIPVNLATHKLLKPIPLPRSAQPSSMAINQSGTELYVVDSGLGSVTPIPLRSDEGKAGNQIPVGRLPDAIAVTPHTAYVANYLSNSVTPINLETDAPGRPITGFHNPVALALTPDDRTIYVVNQGNGTVSPVTIAGGLVGKPIDVGALPNAIAISGSTAYVARQGNVITMISLANNTVQDQILAPHPPWNEQNAADQVHCGTPAKYQSGMCGFGRPTGIAVTCKGRAVYVAGAGRGWLTPIKVTGRQVWAPMHIWDAAALTPLRPASPLAPMPMAISKNGKTAYVANFYQGFLYSIALPMNCPH
jgi:DNA-binding beta-propeller fold protein YncE